MIQIRTYFDTFSGFRGLNLRGNSKKLKKMAEENSFKENLNWKKITIDAVNTVIATAIGIIIGLLVDKWRENISNEENYQKVIVATINNLENYQQQIENLYSWSEYSENVFEEVLSEDYQISDTSADYFENVFFAQDFMQQDRWIEENFITNGGFIENTDLRLKIGNVYSLIDLAKSKFLLLKDASEKATAKYIDYIAKETKFDSVWKKLWKDKDFLNYYAHLSSTNEDIKSYLENIKELTTQIIQMSNADEKALNEMRESSKKIIETLSKSR